MVIILEHYPAPFKMYTFQPLFYDNLNVTLGIGPAKTNPIELMLGLVTLGFVCEALARRHRAWHIQTVSLLGVAYLCWMLVSVVWGIVNHGDWKVALWIVRPVAYFLFFSFLTFQFFRKPKYAAIIIGIIIVLTTVKSFQMIVRKFLSGIPPGSVEAYGSHEDTSFALYTAWLWVTGLFLDFPKLLRRALAAVIPIIVLGVVVNDRRINIATGIVGCVLILLLQSRPAVMRRARLLLIMGSFAFMYLLVGWFGPTNAITQPVKGIKEGVMAEIRGENTDPSSWYRKVERYNLKHTIKANPILGTGLGVRYMQLIKLDQLSFGYAVYISHNQVLLVMSATGLIGFLIFNIFFATLMTQLTIYWRVIDVDWQRATALVGLISVMNWLVVGYYDMQLFFFRNSIFMGVVVAVPAALFRHQVQVAMDRASNGQRATTGGADEGKRDEPTNPAYA